MNETTPAAPGEDAMPSTEAVLAGLKPFQRKTVDYVFRRLYGPDHTRRFLLADEVGLGKTMVARGVIARVIEHLQHCVKRIDVIYICSNHDIARQNINRLNVTGKDDFALASRITLLPTHIGAGGLRNQRLNLVSFTPGTSFDLKSRLGISDERVLLYHLLRSAWQFRGVGPLNVLRGHVGLDVFRAEVDWLNPKTIDERTAAQFLANVDNEPRFKTTFFELCDEFHRSDARVSEEAEAKRNKLIGELRSVLARTCLQSLQPDLIILDEFQRFKHLLRDEQSTESQLAHDLFRYSDEHSEARVLLLSATPYKMYTMSQESAEDDHYADFLDTVRFLLDDSDKTKKVEAILKEYRRQLYSLGGGQSHALGAMRSELEDCLKKVMCRTERLAVTEDRSGMLHEIPTALELEAEDVESYIGFQKIARSLKQRDTVEYWKSAPYLLNFMENYELKEQLRNQRRKAEVVDAVDAVAGSQAVLLPWDRVKNYAPLNPRNSRLRQLSRETVETGAWRLLWIPPSLPYYALASPFNEEGVARFTKRLIFSTWHVVPKAIATLLSYDAERQMVTSHDPHAANTLEGRKGIRPLLNFSQSRDHPDGMPVLGLLYPSFWLAEAVDPLRALGKSKGRQPPTLEAILHSAEATIEEALRPLTQNAPSAGREDGAWYWAAPILLDHGIDDSATESWFADDSLATSWSGGGDGNGEDVDDVDGESQVDVGWQLHVDYARALLKSGPQSLGRPPADLAKVLALMAVAGPAVAALRALGRVSGAAAALRDAKLRHAAGQIAWGFRTLFNSPDVISLVRGMGMKGDVPYWKRVVEYCAGGCLQSVLDEYAHVLRECLGDASANSSKVGRDIADAIVSSLSLRVATPGVDRVWADRSAESVMIENERLRARFAMRFGDERSDDGRLVSRKDHVRQAFNSPFWPFVLVTTSIGQEGLDFHTYCHSIMHWNLPANPVDMEQREGRVHRYKGHAVRRNVVLRHAADVEFDQHPDPWTGLFSAASASEAATGDETGLTPYWIYPVEDGFFIERRVPALPLSREAEQLPALRNSLAVYRMVFGQPRQDDLVEYLLQRLSREEVSKHLEEFRIDLSPEVVSVADSTTWPSAKSPFTGHFGSDQGIVSGAPFGEADTCSDTSSAETTGGAEQGERPATVGTADVAEEATEVTPPPIDEIDRNELLATIRDVFWTGGARQRDDAIREIAAALGYRRTGPRIYEVLSTSIQTAVRRGILVNERGQLSLAAWSIEDFSLDQLVETLLAAMGQGWWTRDEAIVASARHLGFRRTGQKIQAAFKSAINAAIRRGLLERQGGDLIRRSR